MCQRCACRGFGQECMGPWAHTAIGGYCAKIGTHGQSLSQGRRDTHLVPGLETCNYYNYHRHIRELRACFDADWHVCGP
jgi:hypothetical protein